MKEELLKNKELFDQYILVAPGRDYGNIMWQDIGLLDKAIMLENPLKSNNKLIRLIHHVHFSFLINNRVQLPCQSIWKRKYSFSDVNFELKKKYCIIFTDVSACRVDYKTLSDLQKKSNVTMVLTLVNTMFRRGNVIKNRLSCFDLVYTFDKRDADKFNFIYHQNFYSPQKLFPEGRKTDAFYVGVSKGRSAKLNSIYEKIIQNSGKAEFYISGVNRKEMIQPGIHYNKWISYSDTLKYIAETGCIVEVMDGEQEGVTLRTMEAICYNKKLLTNNSSVRNLPFYKSGNIQVFKEINEIDVEFIKDNRVVEYKYSDEFSPVHLIDEINNDILKIKNVDKL